MISQPSANKSLRMPRRHNERGASLTEVVVAVALVGIAAVGTLAVTRNSLNSYSHVTQLLDLFSLKSIVFESTDCAATLAPFPRPYDCAAMSNVVLRRKNGSELFAGRRYGPWTINASCQNSELIVTARRPDLMPGTDRPWSSHYSARDLFGGLSDICRRELETGTSPSNWVSVPCPPHAVVTDGPYTAYCHPPANASPEDICKAAGFDYASGSCRGSYGGNSFMGTIMSNRYGRPTWTMSCLYDYKPDLTEGRWGVATDIFCKND